MEILYDVFLICKIYPRRVFWCIFIFIAAIWTTGVSIKEEKSDEEENTLIIGFFKIMSKISITLLVLTVSVVFMSYFIKPQAKDTMPAFFTNGADTSFFDEVSYEDAIEYPISYASFPAIHILKAQILIHKNNLETSLHP